MKPLLLIDVDGPLNPYAAPERPEGYVDHRVRFQNPWKRRKPPPYIKPLTLWLNPLHGAALQELPYELIWCTSWMHGANEQIGPVVGLPELRVLPLERPPPGSRPDRTCWKTWDIVRWCDGVPFAWVDDQIGAADRQYVQGVHQAPALLHSIDPIIGLVDDDFEILREWAEKLP